MAPNLPLREVSPFLQIVRSVLLGKSPKNYLRFQEQVSVRPGPEPDIPPGPAHKLAANYYFSRDARREVKPPQILLETGSLKALSSGGDGAAVANKAKSKVPGPFLDFGKL